MKRMKKMSRVLGIDIHQVCVQHVHVVPRKFVREWASVLTPTCRVVRCWMVRNKIRTGMSIGNVPASGLSRVLDC